MKIEVQRDETNCVSSCACKWPFGLTVTASEPVWIRRLMGLQGTRRHSRKRESKQIPFTVTEQVRTDTKINHENIGKNRCHDPNARLGKLMWNYFIKHVKHME